MAFHIPECSLWREGWRPCSVPTSTAPICRWQAIGKVLQSFGPIGTPGLENDYCAARAGIPKMLPKEQFKAIEALVDGGATVDDTREDLRVLPLVSIDSPNTVDIDDASARSRRTTAGY